MAYLALVEFHILPHELFSMTENELAFVFACIRIHGKRKKEELDKNQKTMRRSEERGYGAWRQSRKCSICRTV